MLFNQVHHFGHAHAKDYFSPSGCCGVVQMHNRRFGASHRFDGLVYQILARLGDHHGGDTLRDMAVLNQGSGKLVIDLRS